MRIMIVGGTGFLGYYTTLAALEAGHETGSLAIDDVSLDDWFPPSVERRTGNVFEMDEDALTGALAGYDAMVYSIGPDDRVTPKAPAYDFFHERLVTHCARVFRAARRAGVRRAVVYNSYFATLDRLYPKKRLAQTHPYIRCRVEQAERLIAESGDMDVMVLELPYIFGAMPMRTPIWRDVFIERFFRYPVVCFPKGGTTMVHARSVGQAGVAALECGARGERYPVGDENHNYRVMLEWMLEGLSVNKPIVQLPASVCALGADAIARKDARAGKESGLNMRALMRDIMNEELYIPQSTIEEVAGRFGYARGLVREGVLEAMHACYPEGFRA